MSQTLPVEITITQPLTIKATLEVVDLDAGAFEVKWNGVTLAEITLVKEKYVYLSGSYLNNSNTLIDAVQSIFRSAAPRFVKVPVTSIDLSKIPVAPDSE